MTTSGTQGGSTILDHLADLSAHGGDAAAERELEEIRPETLALAEELDAVARLAADCGRTDLAAAALEEKRRRGQATAQDLRELAAAAAASGKLEEALVYLREAHGTAPGDLASIRDLAALLVRLNRVAEAEELVARNRDRLGPAVADRLLEGLVEPGPVSPPAGGDAGGEAGWSAAHVHRFLELFQGRPGTHARQWISPTGASGYTPVDGDLTPALVAGHFRGDQTLGAYQLDPEALVRWVVFDVDIRKEAVAALLRDRRRWRSALDDAFHAAGAIADLCAMEEIPATLEFSGFKGYHIWVFLSRPAPAGSARRFAESIRRRLAELPAHLAVELFPRQTRLQGKHLGSLVKLPLGVHLRSGRRSAFVTARGAEVADPFEHLFTLRAVDPAVLDRCVPPEAPRIETLAAPGDGPAEGAEAVSPGSPPWAPSPQGPPYDPDGDTRLTFLLERCPAQAAVVAKARATGSLTYDEQLALVHTLGHLENGVCVVNHLLTGILPVPVELLLKSRLQGNPASCQKIRARTAALRGGGAEFECACRFGDNPAMYPNPLLHLQECPEGGGGRPTVRERQDRVLRSVRRFLELRESCQRITADYRRSEQDLLALFETESLDEVPTALGTLKRRRLEDGSWQLLLEL